MSTEQSNYVRALYIAGEIVAHSNTDELGYKEVAYNVLELADELTRGQDKVFAREGWDKQAAAKTATSGPSLSSTGSSGSNGSSTLTPKQVASLTKAYKAINDDGKEPPYSFDEIEQLEGRDRSDAIGVIFDLAFGR